jgi:hypothetical protein
MGLRLDLAAANWLAHVLDEKAAIPAFPHEEEWQKIGAIH